MCRVGALPGLTHSVGPRLGRGSVLLFAADGVAGGLGSDDHNHGGHGGADPRPRAWPGWGAQVRHMPRPVCLSQVAEQLRRRVDVVRDAGFGCVPLQCAGGQLVRQATDKARVRTRRRDRTAGRVLGAGRLVVGPVTWSPEVFPASGQRSANSPPSQDWDPPHASRGEENTRHAERDALVRRSDVRSSTPVRRPLSTALPVRRTAVSYTDTPRTATRAPVVPPRRRKQIETETT